MRKLIVLVGLAMGAVVVLGALDVSDAEAGKKTPDYNFVLCSANQDPCSGTSGADLIVGAAGIETLKGAAGNDIYMGSDEDFDKYIDESTSSDLYGGFVNEQFDRETIDDRGGLDRVDLSTSVSPYASADFAFHKVDVDGDGAQDDLWMEEIGPSGDRLALGDILALNHFGSGRIEYIKFSDTTLKAADLIPLLS
jgi:hypothetical protein